MVKEEQRDILSFQVQRTISSLCKHFLNVVEDLQQEYDRYFDTKSNLPPQNFLNDEHFEYLRKRILDKGGDSSRDLLQELIKYHVRLLTNEELQEQAGGAI